MNAPLLYNNVKTPIGISFLKWLPLEATTMIRPGYFYIGILEGYDAFCYYGKDGKIHKHREPHRGRFHLLEQLKEHHYKGGFSFV